MQEEVRLQEEEADAQVTTKEEANRMGKEDQRLGHGEDLQGRQDQMEMEETGVDPEDR